MIGQFIFPGHSASSVLFTPSYPLGLSWSIPVDGSCTGTWLLKGILIPWYKCVLLYTCRIAWKSLCSQELLKCLPFPSCQWHCSLVISTQSLEVLGHWIPCVRAVPYTDRSFCLPHVLTLPSVVPLFALKGLLLLDSLLRVCSWRIKTARILSLSYTLWETGFKFLLHVPGIRIWSMVNLTERDWAHCPLQTP